MQHRNRQYTENRDITTFIKGEKIVLLEYRHHFTFGMHRFYIKEINLS